MENKYSLTEGKVFSSLIRFAVPVLFTLFLQALYGGVDLWVVGQFAETADVSGVATGSMVLQTVTQIVTGLAMGITILVGEKIGKKRPAEAGDVIGSGICLFAVLALILTAIMVVGAEAIGKLMHAPEEAFAQTAAYIRICGAGSVFIVAYNVLGSVFRGIGDSKTPLITVSIACAVNVAGDFLLVAVFHMGAAGAAVATVAAQAVSVVTSYMIIKRKELPFELTREKIRFNRGIIGTELKLGTPVALQDFLVSISFLVIQMVVNTFGVVASAGIGVGEKVCTFIMLVPSAYMQSMSAFVAQNMGAGNPHRAKKALEYGILTSVAVGVVIGAVTFFHGDLLASIFSAEQDVIAAAHSYLKAYAIDCLLTPFLFCFTGYFNGCEKTLFVMIQGITGAFMVRIPVVLLVSSFASASLFQIGLATPASTVVQIVLCLIMFFRMEKRQPEEITR